MKHYYKAPQPCMIGENDPGAIMVFSTAKAGRKYLEYALEEMKKAAWSHITDWKNVSRIRNWCTAHVAAYDVFFEDGSMETIYLEECSFDDLTEA